MIYLYHYYLSNGFRMRKIYFLMACIALSVSSLAFAETPEQKLADEALSCTSYYQISIKALTEMNVPQMKGIAERLKTTEKQAYQLALKYDKNAPNKLAKVKQQQMTELQSSTGLKALITKYRTKCMTLLSNPDKRLEYWQMVLM